MIFTGEFVQWNGQVDISILIGRCVFAPRNGSDKNIRLLSCAELVLQPVKESRPDCRAPLQEENETRRC